ncbi:MAG: Cas10/Cmr2 second palm domain-containing protein, partial [Isosphaeraceae bacterium]
VAVIHADGNGLGHVFLNFDSGLQSSAPECEKQNRRYIDELRCFSLALDECTENAFCAALGELRTRRQVRNGESVLPIVPLVLGGDDLTVVCDGRQAMRFIRRYLEEFEKQTGANSTIRSVMGRFDGQDRVTSCAGVAIVKPHFPFFAAYSLAEELLQSAKKLAKREAESPPFSAVDFHVLYDASAPSLERLRRSLTLDGGTTKLFARPYAVTSGHGPAGRHLDSLKGRVGSIRSTDEDGRRRLPNSMLHELRQGLFLGRARADARLQLTLGRHEAQTFGSLIDQSNRDRPSLFFPEDDQNWYAALLDAMDLAEFWEGSTREPERSDAR